MDNSLANESKETQKDPLPEESKSDCPLSKKVKPDASLTEEEKPEKQQDSLQLALQMLASPPESACEEVMNKWKEFGVLSIEEIRGLLFDYWLSNCLGLPCFVSGLLLLIDSVGLLYFRFI